MLSHYPTTDRLWITFLNIVPAVTHKVDFNIAVVVAYPFGGCGATQGNQGGVLH